MSTKKTVAKKTTKAKPAAKAKPKAKATAKPKAKPKAKSSAQKTVARTRSSLGKAAGARRPPNNPSAPQQVIDELTNTFNEIKTELDSYAAHLRALDRKRLNGVGIKKQGFIDRAYEYSVENPEFLPHYLTLEKFREDNEYYVSFRNLFDVCKQIQEILWNITIQSSDIVYTDALEFYASVREASKRRVDAAETIYKDLEMFFKKTKKTAGEEIEIKETIKE